MKSFSLRLLFLAVFAAALTCWYCQRLFQWQAYSGLASDIEVEEVERRYDNDDIDSNSLAQDLRRAVASGDVAKVKALLDSGADVNTPHENRITVIYFASDPIIVDLLIARGAKLDIRDAARIQSPIEHAAERYWRDEENRKKWSSIVDSFRQAGAPYTIDTAIYMNDLAFVRQTLVEGASWVNKRREAQSVPLRVAARVGRIEICKLLLENHADPDSFDEGSGYPILVDAIRHPPIVRLLISHGANLRRRITWLGGSSGVQIIGDEATALHFAVEAGNLDSVKILVDAGLDPNAADVEGQTPLHIAIRCERWEDSGKREVSSFFDIVEFLLKSDASLSFANRQGKKPIDMAVELKSPRKILRILKEKQEEIDSSFLREIFGNKEVR